MAIDKQTDNNSGQDGQHSVNSDFERRMETLFGNLPGMVYRCMNNSSWTMLSVSEGCEMLTGYKPNEIQNDRIIAYGDLILEEDAGLVYKVVNDAIKDDRHFEIEYRITDKAGKQKWVWERGLGVKDPEFGIISIEGFITDISRFKKAEQKSELIEAKFEALFENSLVVMLLIHPETQTIVDVNRAALNFYGLSREELVGKKLNQINILTEEEIAVEIDQVKSQNRNYFLFKHKLANGEVRDVEVFTSRIVVAGEEYLYSLVHDVTERKRIEERLLFNQFGIDHAQIAVYQITDEGNIAYANKYACELLGYSESELLKLNVFDISSSYGPDLFKRNRELIRQSGHGTILTAHKRKDGTEFPVEVTVHYFEYKNEMHSFSFVKDISERVEAELRLEQEKQYLANVIKGTNVGTWSWDIQTGKSEYNDRWAEMLGFELAELQPTNHDTWKQFLHPDDKDYAEQQLRKHIEGEVDQYEVEIRMKHRAGSWIWVHTQGKVVKWDDAGHPKVMFGTHADITEKKKSELELARQKDELELLFTISNLVATSPNYKVALLHTLGQVCNKTGWELGEVWIPNEEQAILEYGEAWFTQNENLSGFIDLSRKYSFRKGEGLPGMVWKEREPIWVDDVQNYPHFLRQAEAKKFGIKAGIALPVIADGEVVNVLVFFLLVQKKESKDFVRLISGVTMQLGQLFQRKKVEEEVLILNERLHSLIDAIKELSKVRTMNGIMKTLRYYARMLTNADGATIVLKEGENCFYADEDAISPLWKGKRFPLTSCISGWAMLNKKAVAISDIYEDSRIPHEAYRPTFVKSLGMVPIRISNPIGAIGAYWATKHQPTGTELSLIQTLADAASSTIENVKLLEDLELMVKARTAKLETLTDELRKQVEIRRRSEEEISDLYNNAPCGYHSLDPDGFFVRINTTELNWLQYPEDEILHKKKFLDIATEDSRKRFIENFPRFKRNGQISDLEFDIIRKDGTILPVLLSATAINDENGNFVRSRSTMFDITEIRQAQLEIKKLNSELRNRADVLEMANKELESFSYSVSHDLRAPLRHINGFTDLLLKDHIDNLPDDAKRYLQTIASSATKMGTLIDDLLQFSKTGRQELKKTVCPTLKVVKDVLSEYALQIEDRNVQTRIELLPDIFADCSLMRQVWTNLIDNALKYTRKKEHAEIAIGFQENDEEVIFYVKDNGDGFDMQYAHKLFGVFQRMHSVADFEGTGIGLANVRRIVSRHSGRTWADASPGKGATFYFSIPKKTIIDEL